MIRYRSQEFTDSTIAGPTNSCHWVFMACNLLICLCLRQRYIGESLLRFGSPGSCGTQLWAERSVQMAS
ncbi:hypothetical protein BCR37DRAFT_382092 [Protomyces lactucae-debilis]|uniref:Uncharacterized protein n=1 Tax=Protomyces lactucae-debilis TaxID=2754530 RepID=A0A1Y2F6Y6_PROLT|nr:uncharacterized protein BCR37DRAFT_382092 [Protomyces lactucae-debilis]ORY79096.1 hypothetical protein BCR37DRAFT_382092 [Protomyces lactucae-debilis]